MFSGPYNLLLAPHPDDLVFSAFSALSSKEKKLAIVFFNVSTFSRWPIRSRTLVTLLRTLEDKFILNFLGTKVKYLFKKDSSLLATDPTNNKAWASWIKPPPSSIFCPLGIGEHPNHKQVRN